MAITIASLIALRDLIASTPYRPVRMISGGYPDILIRPSEIERLLGEGVARSLIPRPDSAGIIVWHGLTGQLDSVPETVHFFSLLNVELTVLDIQPVRGGEILHDLNTPLPAALTQQFDIVYDGGTLEHCFNVGQAVSNFLALAKVNGFIYHSNLFNVPNHGFYNFCPTFYHDSYVGNGHKLLGPIQDIGGTPLEPGFATWPSTQRFKTAIGECAVTLAAQKLHADAPRWPMQTKYQKKPAQGGMSS